jgi:Fe-Mn family superoxide dismutase
MAHKLPDLPFAPEGLEPHISAKTFGIHHGKHHAAYVAKLNAALEGQSGLTGKSLEDLIRNLDQVPADIAKAVRLNGCQHYNHSMFWTVMKAGGGGEPTGELAEAINGTFGSFATFKEKFSAAAANQFGSGWAWLSIQNGKLDLTATSNEDTPLAHGGTPLLTIDVWEHAYYLDYQNRRPDFIAAWWNVVNWDQVTAYMKKA